MELILFPVLIEIADELGKASLEQHSLGSILVMFVHLEMAEKNVDEKLRKIKDN